MVETSTSVRYASSASASRPNSSNQTACAPISSMTAATARRSAPVSAIALEMNTRCSPNHSRARPGSARRAAAVESTSTATTYALFPRGRRRLFVLVEFFGEEDRVVQLADRWAQVLEVRLDAAALRAFAGHDG